MNRELPREAAAAKGGIPSRPPAPNIVATPGICGGDARVQGTRVPVWLLEQIRRQGALESEIGRMYPWLSAEHVRAAWAYADDHREEIEAAIRANEGPAE